MTRFKPRFLVEYLARRLASKCADDRTQGIVEFGLTGIS
jgi:hypothetical protein